MRGWLLVLAACGGTGCSWVLQPHLRADSKGKTEPACSTSGGFALADGIFVAANLLAVIAETQSSDPNSGIYIAADTAGVLIHTLSAITGAHWASRCREAKAQWEDEEDRRPEKRAQAAPSAGEQTPSTPPAERKIVTGDDPLLCTVQLTDDEIGSCFHDGGLCVAERERLGDTMSACTAHTAGACFNATTVLDDERVTVCAPSIKDCERRREKMFADPDYTSVTETCGIYRTRPRVEQGSAQAP